MNPCPTCGAQMFRIRGIVAPAYEPSWCLTCRKIVHHVKGV